MASLATSNFHDNSQQNDLIQSVNPQRQSFSKASAPQQMVASRSSINGGKLVPTINVSPVGVTGVNLTPTKGVNPFQHNQFLAMPSMMPPGSSPIQPSTPSKAQGFAAKGRSHSLVGFDPLAKPVSSISHRPSAPSLTQSPVARTNPVHSDPFMALTTPIQTIRPSAASISHSPAPGTNPVLAGSSPLSKRQVGIGIMGNSNGNQNLNVIGHASFSGFSNQITVNTAVQGRASFQGITNGFDSNVLEVSGQNITADTKSNGFLAIPKIPTIPATPPKMMQSQLPRKSLTPVSSSTKTKTRTKQKHRRDIQSFCTSDLRSISSDAMEQESLNGDAIDLLVMSMSSSLDSNDAKAAAATVAQPLKTQPSDMASNKKEVTMTPYKESKKKDSSTNDTTPKKENPNKKGPVTPKKETPKQAESKDDTKDTSKEDTARKSATSQNSLTPTSVFSMRPWAKKGHRRIKSLECKDDPPNRPPTDKKTNRASLPSTPASERRSSMYPAIVQDLMEMKFNQLQIPSLAKPSPTSFLTGKDDEVVRTCELDPSPHQMEIPTLPEFVVSARLNEFVENYRRVDQNFDLQQWAGMSRMDLLQVRIPQHQPIVQSLLECGDDVSLQGVISKGTSADDRVEVAIFEGQRQFTAVFRGTTEQQCKPGGSLKSKKHAKNAAVPLDAEHGNVEVYGCFKEEYQKLEHDCFALLDKLTEQNPFCDVVFTGHSFGAAVATLAAFRYANARAMMRVSCLTMASPKVGFSAFKQLVNSSPNLKVMRLEFGQDGKCQAPSLGGYHVGHTLVLHGSLGHNSLKTNHPVLAYKFDTPKYKKFKTMHPDLRSYVSALEEMARLGLPWAKDFVGTSGQGVVVNNETRQVV